MSFQLTDEERKISEDNINLMYKAMHRYGFSLEEYSGIASFAYCRSVHYWCHRKNKKLSLSTFVYRHIRHSVLNEIRGLSRAKRQATMVDFDNDIVNNNGIVDENYINFENNLFLESFYTLITADEKFVFNGHLDGKSLREIASEMGCSYEWVRILLKRVKQKAIGELNPS